MASDLQALLERVRKTTGPDREIDGAIAIAIGGFFIDGERYGEPAFCYERDGELRRPGGHGMMMVPEYTASVDAVVALAELELPGWEWTVSRISDGRYYAGVRRNGKFDDFSAVLSTAALAFLAAFLAAVIAKEGDDGA